MINKINSDKISVYPCGNRYMGIDPNARLNTEYNLVSIVNRLVDMKSFCITEFVSGQDFVFNVGGYLFNMNSGWFTSLESLFDGKNYLYAGICVGKMSVSLDGSQTTSHFQELLPLTVDTSLESIVEIEDMDTYYSGNSVFNGVVIFPYDRIVEPGDRGSDWVSSSNASGIFANIDSPLASANKEYYILPILEKVTDKTGAVSYRVPQVSKVKMCTSKNGTSRSITIDDGELG